MTKEASMLMGKKIKLSSCTRHLSKCLMMDVTEVPLMIWKYYHAPSDLTFLLIHKKLFQKAVKKRGDPDYIELFFYGQGTDGYTSSWEFKFPKKGFSIVVHWLG